MRTEAGTRKKAVNLTLREDLVISARACIPNLSATVELLLTEHLANRQAAKDARMKQLEESLGAWNRFNESHPSLADEHSTL
jgi:post-segregation antitoxin (ccd killing protein)